VERLINLVVPTLDSNPAPGTGAMGKAVQLLKQQMLYLFKRAYENLAAK
jgi:hypothetical protein